MADSVTVDDLRRELRFPTDARLVRGCWCWEARGGLENANTLTRVFDRGREMGWVIKTTLLRTSRSVSLASVSVSPSGQHRLSAVWRYGRVQADNAFVLVLIPDSSCFPVDRMIPSTYLR